MKDPNKRAQEDKVMDAAEAIIKQAMADGASPEEALAWMNLGAIGEVYFARLKRDDPKWGK